jgi:hypothetical protein
MKNRMPKIDIQSLVLSRLGDFADQCAELMNQGNYEDAVLIREEGYLLAEAYDQEETFMFLPDFKIVN